VWCTPLPTHVILVSRGEGTEGVVRGRRTSVVYVKTTRRIEGDAEIFAKYGNEFRFAGVCVCHLCRLDGT
jgi:hypothetical protein